MSTSEEIAAPLGKEAWDDTALLDVASKKESLIYRHLNEL
jgi:hypothetical protein